VCRSLAQKLLGHLTPSIFLRHAIVSDQDLAEGVEVKVLCRLLCDRNLSKYRGLLDATELRPV